MLDPLKRRAAALLTVDLAMRDSFFRRELGEFEDVVSVKVETRTALRTRIEVVMEDGTHRVFYVSLSEQETGPRRPHGSQ